MIRKLGLSVSAEDAVAQNVNSDNSNKALFLFTVAEVARTFGAAGKPKLSVSSATSLKM